MIKRKKDRMAENLTAALLTLSGFLAVAAVIAVTVFLTISGLPAIGKIGISEFFFGTSWAPTAQEPSYGILMFILTSAWGSLGAILIGVPVGVLCAIAIATSKNKAFSSVLLAAVELLAGIPSVVYGLLGMIVVVPWVRETFSLPDGATLFSAIIVLSVMILPSVISVSETAIRSVPNEYEKASLALGATKTETVFKIIVPSAKSGILTAVVLGIGRSIGEAMAVMMVAGNVANMPSLFGSVRFLTTAVASEMSYSSGLHREALYSVALVLLMFIFIINMLLGLIGKRERK